MAHIHRLSPQTFFQDKQSCHNITPILRSTSPSVYSAEPTTLATPSSSHSSSTRPSVRFVDSPHPRRANEIQYDEPRRSKTSRRIMEPSSHAEKHSRSPSPTTTQTTILQEGEDCPYLLAIEGYLGKGPSCQSSQTRPHPKSHRRPNPVKRRGSYTPSDLFSSSTDTCTTSVISGTSSTNNLSEPAPIAVKETYLMDCSSLPPLPRRRPGDPPVRQRCSFSWQEELVAELNRRVDNQRRKVAELRPTEDLRLEDSDDIEYEEQNVDSGRGEARADHERNTSSSPSVFSEDSWIGGNTSKARRHSLLGSGSSVDKLVSSIHLAAPAVDVQKAKPSPPSSWAFNVHSKHITTGCILTSEKQPEVTHNIDAVPRIFDTSKFGVAVAISELITNKPVASQDQPLTRNGPHGLNLRRTRRHAVPHSRLNIRSTFPVMPHGIA